MANIVNGDGGDVMHKVIYVHSKSPKYVYQEGTSQHHIGIDEIGMVKLVFFKLVFFKLVINR